MDDLSRAEALSLLMIVSGSVIVWVTPVVLISSLAETFRSMTDRLSPRSISRSAANPWLLITTAPRALMPTSGVLLLPMSGPTRTSTLAKRAKPSLSISRKKTPCISASLVEPALTVSEPTISTFTWASSKPRMMGDSGLPVLTRNPCSDQ